MLSWIRINRANVIRCTLKTRRGRQNLRQKSRRQRKDEKEGKLDRFKHKKAFTCHCWLWRWKKGIGKQGISVAPWSRKYPLFASQQGKGNCSSTFTSNWSQPIILISLEANSYHRFSVKSHPINTLVLALWNSDQRSQLSQLQDLIYIPVR